MLQAHVRALPEPTSHGQQRQRLHHTGVIPLFCVTCDVKCDAQQVCRQFEMLVQSQAPSVFMHMLRFGVQPLKVAFPWLMFGFSGTLDVCEVMPDVTRHTSHVTRHITGVAAVGPRHRVRLAAAYCSARRCRVCVQVGANRAHVTRRTSHVTRHTSHVTLHTSHVTRQTRSKAILDSSNADMINEVFEDLTRIRFYNRFPALNEQCVCGVTVRRVVPLMQWFIFRDSAVPTM